MVYEFNVSAGNKIWATTLKGTENSAGNREWAMTLTTSVKDANGCCTDFTVLSGLDRGNGIGSWQLFDTSTPTERNQLIAVSYNYTAADSRSLTYSINSLKASTAKFGNSSSVAFSESGNSLTLKISDSSVNDTVNVAWDKVTKAGNYSSDSGATLCWDEEVNGFVDLDSCG